MTTVVVTLWFFYKACNSKLTMFVLVAWVAVQAIISDAAFYVNTTTIPPRFLLLIVPPLVLIVVLLVSKRGRAFLDTLDTTWLTYLHVVRIPVEITLYFLCTYKVVPELMTFEGRNFDILSGVTAPVIAYFGYTKNKIAPAFLIAWNFGCLALLFNIVTWAVLSAPFPFQQLAFDQPNIGILYFPFSWLPALVVPLVLLSHVACLRRLLKK